MSTVQRRRVRALLRAVLAGAVLVPVIAWGAGGGVTSSTRQHSYIVNGTTPLSLVRYMNSHALSGDNGHAYASIHPSYTLSVTTKQNGAQCRPTQIGVNVTFDLSLPVAANPGGMSRRTRTAWNNFLAFARAHEAHHKASYLDCATAFVAAARHETASQCVALEGDIRQMFRQMQRDCEARQIPFDRSQHKVLANLQLFSMARFQSYN